MIRIVKHIERVKDQLDKANIELVSMYSDPEYIKTMEASRAGVGWGLHGKTQEDIDDWHEAIDEQKELINYLEYEIAILQEFVNEGHEVISGAYPNGV